ncbi:MAG: hypothetical protein Q9159_005597 [Coniocarpon cinnabarinum]
MTKRRLSPVRDSSSPNTPRMRVTGPSRTRHSSSTLPQLPIPRATPPLHQTIPVEYHSTAHLQHLYTTSRIQQASLQCLIVLHEHNLVSLTGLRHSVCYHTRDDAAKNLAEVFVNAFDGVDRWSQDAGEGVDVRQMAEFSAYWLALMIVRGIRDSPMRRHIRARNPVHHDQVSNVANSNSNPYQDSHHRNIRHGNEATTNNHSTVQDNNNINTTDCKENRHGTTIDAILALITHQNLLGTELEPWTEEEWTERFARLELIEDPFWICGPRGREFTLRERRARLGSCSWNCRRLGMVPGGPGSWEWILPLELGSGGFGGSSGFGRSDGMGWMGGWMGGRHGSGGRSRGSRTRGRAGRSIEVAGYTGDVCSEREDVRLEREVRDGIRDVEEWQAELREILREREAAN